MRRAGGRRSRNVRRARTWQLLIHPSSLSLPLLLTVLPQRKRPHPAKNRPVHALRPRHQGSGAQGGRGCGALRTAPPPTTVAAGPDSPTSSESPSTTTPPPPENRRMMGTPAAAAAPRSHCSSGLLCVCVCECVCGVRERGHGRAHALSPCSLSIYHPIAIPTHPDTPRTSAGASTPSVTNAQAECGGAARRAASSRRRWCRIGRRWGARTRRRRVRVEAGGGMMKSGGWCVPSRFSLSLSPSLSPPLRTRRGVCVWGRRTGAWA